MKKLILLILLYPSMVLAQWDCTTSIYDLNSPQLEEIIVDFINDEKTKPYYSDSCSFQLTINNNDDEYFCILFADGINLYRNDTLFINGDIEPSRTFFMEYLGHIFRIYFRNDIVLSFLKQSNKCLTIVTHYSSIQDEYEMIDDTVWPSYLMLSYCNGVFNVLRKTKAIY